MKGISPIDEPTYEASLRPGLRFDASHSFTASSECPIACTGSEDVHQQEAEADHERRPATR